MTLPCGVCGRKFPTLFGLMEHKRMHSGDRPYVCQVCQKRFTQKAHLVIHKRTHTGEKPYACHICHKRFAQSSHLNNHKRIHTGEKPYFCNICNLGFSRKQRLELHVLQHASNNSGSSGGNNNNNNNISGQPNSDDVNSTITSNAKTLYSSEVESTFSRSLDSSQSQVQISPSEDPSLQNLNFSHRRKPAYVTRVNNDEFENIQTNFDPQALPDIDEGNSYGLTNITSGHHGSLMKPEPKDYEEFEAMAHDLDTVARSNINQVMNSEAMMNRQLVADHIDHDIREQQKTLEDSLVAQVEGSGHPELMRDIHSSSDPDVSGICAVSTTDIHHVMSGDDGDGASVTSESNNSNSEQSISSRMMTKRSVLGHPMVKMSKSPLSQMHMHANRQRMMMPYKATVTTSSSAASSSSFSRHNNRVCLMDFSAEELFAHLMARDDVYRCDFCCTLFQDGAMYHLHRSMHDKMDCRCCNICGRPSKDKHDFIAHFLSEHK